MRNGIRLKNRQFDELDSLPNTTASADIYRNCSFILLSDGGHTIPGIAEILGCSPETVNRVRKLFREGGIAALTPNASSGRPSKAFTGCLPKT
jgi:transposase